MSVPDWAFAVAAERCNAGNKSPLTVEQWRGQTAFYELARTIAEHEEPPVAKGPHMDLTYATAEQLSQWLCEAADNVSRTRNFALPDNLAGWEPRLMRKAAEALKRGMELAK